MTKPAVQPDPVAVITKALHDQEHEPVEDIVEGDPENIVCAGDEIVGQGMIEQMARSGWQMTRLRTEVGHLHRDVLWCGQCEAPWSFEQMENMHEVRAHISTCEGQHVQQVAYSTYHDALTQVCFTERVVRSSLPRQLLQEQPTERGED